MKLYTEEQVKEMLIKTDQFTPLHIDHLMNEIISIELPSDEEIEESSPFRLGSGNYNASFSHRWQQGAKWMRDKIQGGDK
jgi:hypothetical protein